AFAIHLLPGDRHGGILHPGVVAATEGGGGEYLVVGVDVHVVLLADHFEVVQARGDRVLVVDDVHGVADAVVARVLDPLAANHVFIALAGMEGVTKAAVPAGNSSAAGDRRQEAVDLLAADGPLRPDLHDQVH